METPRTSIDRERLRVLARHWSSHQRRLVVERILEQLDDGALDSLLDGIAHLPRTRHSPHESSSLDARVVDHVVATLRGDFMGPLVIRNAHGQRAPSQTNAWLAATSHLFDLAISATRAHGDTDPLAVLVDLVEQVDRVPDEFVTFEESCARDELWDSLESAWRRLSTL